MQGRGVFTGRDTIEVNGKTLRFKKAVVATGGSARVADRSNIMGMDKLQHYYGHGRGRLSFTTGGSARVADCSTILVHGRPQHYLWVWPTAALLRISDLSAILA